MSDIQKTLDSLYSALNQTVFSLYDSLASMSTHSFETYNNIGVLKKAYENNCKDQKFLNNVIITMIPHIPQIKSRNKEYFVQFIMDRVESNLEKKQIEEINSFINKISQKHMDLLWTFADNFMKISERFQTIFSEKTWLKNECLKDIIRIKEIYGGEVKIIKGGALFGNRRLKINEVKLTDEKTNKVFELDPGVIQNLPVIIKDYDNLIS